MKNIDFGIDLGTTNSGIGKYENGKVLVLKNPVGLGEILPSVVSFYRGRTLVGNKAREQFLSNAGNVFSAFKRKMGTSEKYHVNQQEKMTEITPVDLSAYVLKELKNYTHGIDINSVVITIPASFDTIQSNATKNAGYQAGFKEVVLLQEPIAACLAYANVSHLNITDEQKWLVYDFGGGTFDVALVYINQRELKVLDNKGNNFLGGVDIDNEFIALAIVPALANHLSDPDLWAKLINKEGVYQKLWYYLSYLAEEAKKELSVLPKTLVEVDFPDLDIFHEIELSRDSLNLAVKPKYQESEQFILELLHDNGITINEIDRILLVGGTTYTPFIRESLLALGTKVDYSIDPTTAVIVGAAYFAGAFPCTEIKEATDLPKAASVLDIKLSAETYSNDLEELIAFKTEEPFAGFYRISRNDGGFDTGLREFNLSASEFVTLLPKTKNIFRLNIFNQQQNLIFESQEIVISQGLYSISGQLLPEDICIELDDKENGTYLEAIFKRNNILPLSKTLYKTFSKSVVKNGEDKIVINVLEGRSGTLPGSNLSIGYIEISGKEIQSDLIQGTDIEIQVNMDESRGLTVDIYIPSTGQQIIQSFHLSKREISVSKMLHEVASAEALLAKEIAENNNKEFYELSTIFQKIGNELQALKIQLLAILNDRATEEKYRLDERKRKLLSDLDNLTRARDVFMAINKYNAEKENYLRKEKNATILQKNSVKKIFDAEKEFLQSGDKHLIGNMAEDLKDIAHKIENEEDYIFPFYKFRSYPEHYYSDSSNLEHLFESGEKAITARDFLQLKHIVFALYTLLDDSIKKQIVPAEASVQHIINPSTFKTGLK